MAPTTLKKAEQILGPKFIGPKQLGKIKELLNISELGAYPKIPYSAQFLLKLKQKYLLVLGIPFDKNKKPLTINQMRIFFGIDPNKKEPCFYNQDWYLKEPFASKKNLEYKWYLVKKEVVETSRGIDPEVLQKKLSTGKNFPQAVLLVFTFFAYYFLTKKLLWMNDFVWCEDKDLNGDRIYVGRYEDPLGINKNGFNIHRKLSIKMNYGLITIDNE